MFTFTRPRTSRDELLGVVQDLATVTPYVDPRMRWTAVEWRAYADGYYRALVQALRAMEFRITQREARAALELEDARRRARRYFGVVMARERSRAALERRKGAA